jgi:6-phosphogluconate dehydrogenase
MAKADIGLIGLGVMGSNLALNIAEKGHRVAVFNRTAARTTAFAADAGRLADRIVPCLTIAEFAEAIRPPRPVIVMVQAGKAVDEQIALLSGVLSAGDIIIDAGNANFRDTMRRFDDMKGTGVGRRGGRAPRPVDHGRRQRGVLAPRRGRADGDLGQI